MDKENQSQVNVVQQVRVTGLPSGPVGKTFQSNQSAQFQQTVRRALGDVNTFDVNQTGSKNDVFMKDLARANLKPNKPVLSQKQSYKFLKLAVPSSKPTQKVKSTVNHEKRVPCYEDDIEFMNNTPETDDFSDIWSMNERPSAYLKELKGWRPVQIGEFKFREEKITILSDDEYTPRVTSSQASLNQHLPVELEELTMEELMLPPLEDLFDKNCDLFCSLP